MSHTINRLKIAVLILSVVTFASGQPLTGYGPKLGLNLANVGGDDAKDPDPSMKIGAAVGGFATLDFDLPVTFQLEGLYSMKGYVLEEGGDKFTVAVNYLDINLLVVYNINESISVFAGPTISPFIGGKTTFDPDPENWGGDIESDDMNGMDFGLTLGGGYGLALPFGDIVVEARYSLGLKKAYDEDWDLKNNVIQIMVGYAL